jgi:hypothetical protein
MQIDSTRLDECKCARTWVLVVHNSFKGVANYERIGNDFDVSNLRRAFSTQRQCRFAELADCCSADILRALSEEQRFVQLFHPEDDCKSKEFRYMQLNYSPENFIETIDEPLCCQPEVLLLFVLTHGEKGGVILSDHLLQGCDQGNPKFDSYTTQNLWNGLSSLEVLHQIPKVMFLAVGIQTIYCIYEDAY